MHLEIIAPPEETKEKKDNEIVAMAIALLEHITEEQGLTNNKTYASKGQAQYYGRKLKKEILRVAPEFDDLLIVKTYPSVKDEGRFYFIIIKARKVQKEARRLREESRNIRAQLSETREESQALRGQTDQA